VINSWILSGARVALGPRQSEALELELRAGKISALVRPGGRARRFPSLDLRGCLVLPGLINAHDHLEFGVFPRLGRGPYPNSRAWAGDIYHPEQSPVRELLRIPLATRLIWGAVSNLLCGVTTVCHHNPYYTSVFRRDFPVRVPRLYSWAHSLEFSPDLVNRFKRAPLSRPFILHLGEAVDRRGEEEVCQLDAVGALDSRTVLVHGVALGPRGLRLVRERAASLVWCPSSNAFILGRTLKAAVFTSGVRVALGTDSAMSREGGLLDELRFARKSLQLPASRLYSLVTRDAAEIMRLRMGEGSLSQGAVADLLVVCDRGQTPAATLLGLRVGDIELVLVGGEVKLCSTGMIDLLPDRVRRSLRALATGERKQQRVFVAVDVAKLQRDVEDVREHLGPALRAMLGSS
jgi:hypothetical protein